MEYPTRWELALFIYRTLARENGGKYIFVEDEVCSGQGRVRNIDKLDGPRTGTNAGPAPTRMI